MKKMTNPPDLSPLLTLEEFALFHHLIRPTQRRSSFMKMAKALYQRYPQPRILMDLYDDLYFETGKRMENPSLNLDQLTETIGAACLIALEYARYVEASLHPFQSYLTTFKGAWLEMKGAWRIRLASFFKE